MLGEKQKLSLQKAWDSEGDSLQNNDGLRYVAYFSIDKYHDRIAEGLQKAIVITADEGEYVMEEEVIDEAKQSTLKDSKEKSGLVKTRSNYTLQTMWTIVDYILQLQQKGWNSRPLFCTNSVVTPQCFFLKT